MACCLVARTCPCFFAVDRPSRPPPLSPPELILANVWTHPRLSLNVLPNSSVAGTLGGVHAKRGRRAARAPRQPRTLYGAFHFLGQQQFMPRMCCQEPSCAIQRLAASTETKGAAGSFATPEVRRQRQLFIIVSELYTHRKCVHPMQSPLPFCVRHTTVEDAAFFYTLLYTTCTLYLKRVHPVQVCLVCGCI